MGILNVEKQSDTGATGSTTNQPIFLEPKTLTFSGVTLAAAAIYNFFIVNSGLFTIEGFKLTPFWFAGIISALIGIGLIWVGLAQDGNTDSKPKQIVTGIFNTFLLWIAVFGASAAGVIATNSSTNLV